MRTFQSLNAVIIFLMWTVFGFERSEAWEGGTQTNKLFSKWRQDIPVYSLSYNKEKEGK